METILLLAIVAFAAWVCWRWFFRSWLNGLSATRAVKAKLMARGIPEEAYFEQAAHEIQNGNIRQGLWAKAWSEAQGDTTKAQALYIKLRVDAMRAEAARRFHQITDGERDNSPTLDEVEGKTVIPCPRCRAKLRVPSGKHLNVKCPMCNWQFVALTAPP